MARVYEQIKLANNMEILKFSLCIKRYELQFYSVSKDVNNNNNNNNNNAPIWRQNVTFTA